MLVRIQLGQQANPFGSAEGVLYFQSEPRALLEGEWLKKQNHFLLRKKQVCLSINSSRISERSELIQIHLPDSQAYLKARRENKKPFLRSKQVCLSG
jgi:hypothetical protein